MSGSQSRSEDALGGAVVSIVILVAIVATIVAIWFAVRTANSLTNAFALRPRSRILWGLIALLLVCATFAVITQAVFWLGAALVAALLLVASARAIVVSSEPLLRDPARHEFLNDVLTDWWPDVPGTGWAEIE